MPELSRSRIVIASASAVGLLLLGWLAFGPRGSEQHAVPRAGDADTGRATPAAPAAGGASTSGGHGASVIPDPLLSVRAPGNASAEPGSVAGEPRAALAGAPPYTGPVRDRSRADHLREALAMLYAGKLAAEGATSSEPAGMPAPEGSGNQADAPLGRYVGRVMQEQFVPLAGSCYEELLSRRPDLAGNVELEFSIMGERAVGGVVVDVALGNATTLKDRGFETCVTESMYAVVFEAPPEGHPTVTVTQSFELAP